MESLKTNLFWKSKRRLLVLIFFIFLYPQSKRPYEWIEFVDVWWTEGCDRPGLAGYDCNHNNKKELVMHYVGIENVYTKIFENIENTNYIVKFIDTFRYFTGAIGDTDTDSLTDMCTKLVFDSIYIQESPSYDSFPTQIVWIDNPPRPIIQVSAVIADLDKDNRKEIWIDNDSYIRGYENIDNNQFVIIFNQSQITMGDGIAFGDFDLDNKMEFVVSMYNTIRVFECTGDNSFELVFMDTIPVGSSIERISANDMDGDGKPEFIIGGSAIDMNFTKYFVFETTGDNQYEITYTFTFNIAGFFFYSADVGDLDNDGKEEIVLSPGGRSGVYIYKAIGNNSYVQVGYIPSDFVEVAVLCYDFDQDGYDEIVFSQEDPWSTPPRYETRIYKNARAIAKEKRLEHPSDFAFWIENTFTKDNVEINYSLPLRTKVKISVFDENGRFIRKLTDEQKSAGYYRVRWDLKDENGKKVHAGNYFIQFKTDEYKEVKKVAVID
ncbi:MAG: FG-GAP-like repeat-containing protein [candidate division WOR-3 bacterium]